MSALRRGLAREALEGGLRLDPQARAGRVALQAAKQHARLRGADLLQDVDGADFAQPLAIDERAVELPQQALGAAVDFQVRLPCQGPFQKEPDLLAELRQRRGCLLPSLVLLASQVIDQASESAG